MHGPLLSRDARWWFAATLPLSLAALFLHVVSEWLFFVTKQSGLTMLPWPERVGALATAGALWVDELFLAQLAATGVALCHRRLRAVALAPAAAILGLLLLLLADNFTYVVFGFSSIQSPWLVRLVYAPLLMIAAAIAGHTVYGLLQRRRESAPRATLVALYCLALPPVVGGFYERLFTDPFIPASPAAVMPDRASLPNILLLGSDGLLAREMSAYGSARPTTPFLESIRDQTLFCENAFSNAAVTYSSTVTLLTGKLPMSTHVFAPPERVPEAIAREHLPGVLRRYGYRTLQLSIRYYGDATEANLKGSFDLANYRWERLLPGTSANADAAPTFREDVIDRLEMRILHISGVRAAPDAYGQVTALRPQRNDLWGDERRVSTLIRFMQTSPRPWFAHVHLQETHDGGPLPPDRAPGETPDEARMRRADAWFKKIADALEASGQLERTVIVFSSDHGRGWTTHERVPLMIRFPHGKHARREAHNVQLADVAPTLVDYLGLPQPYRFDGLSLLRPDALHEDRPIFSVVAYGPARITRPRIHGYLTGMVIIGSQWLSIHLERPAPKVGMTDRADRRTIPEFKKTAAGLLTRKLIDSGFEIAESSARQN